MLKQTILYLIFKVSLLTFFCFVLVACSESVLRNEEEVTIVRVLPLSHLDEAPEEAYYWEKQKMLFPQITIPDPLSKGTPNDDNLLIVVVIKDRKILLENQIVGDLSNTEILQSRLGKYFS